MKPTTDAAQFPALEELGAEFARVARSEARPRRRPKVRRLALALAVALSVVPAGFAVAQGDDAPTTNPDAPAVPPSALEAPEVTDRLQALGVNNVDAAAEKIAELREEARQNPTDRNVIGTSIPPTLVEDCRADPHAEDACGIALAVADGKLAPGNYTDAELQEAVRAAGYEWAPSD